MVVEMVKERSWGIDSGSRICVYYINIRNYYHNLHLLLSWSTAFDSLLLLTTHRSKIRHKVLTHPSSILPKKDRWVHMTHQSLLSLGYWGLRLCYWVIEWLMWINNESWIEVEAVAWINQTLTPNKHNISSTSPPTVRQNLTHTRHHKQIFQITSIISSIVN